MNIEIDMSGFDAALNEAVKIVAPETLEAANRESGEYLRDYLVRRQRTGTLDQQFSSYAWPGTHGDRLVFQYCP